MAGSDQGVVTDAAVAGARSAPLVFRGRVRDQDLLVRAALSPLAGLLFLSPFGWRTVLFGPGLLLIVVALDAAAMLRVRATSQLTLDGAGLTYSLPRWSPSLTAMISNDCRGRRLTGRVAWRDVRAIERKRYSVPTRGFPRRYEYCWVVTPTAEVAFESRWVHDFDRCVAALIERSQSPVSWRPLQGAERPPAL